MSDEPRYRTRRDPDFVGLSLRMHRAMNLAFEQGRISWVRREEMRANILSQIELSSYEVMENGKITICVFGEPSADFMREIGVMTFEVGDER